MTTRLQNFGEMNSFEDLLGCVQSKNGPTQIGLRPIDAYFPALFLALVNSIQNTNHLQRLFGEHGRGRVIDYCLGKFHAFLSVWLQEIREEL